MNVHHLELFYYVAKHGGISAAVRNIPYGIQQPAVSGQMGKLEEDAGAKLFERTPFRLTPAGVTLFAHVQPFFENLGALGTALRAESKPALRIGGSEVVLRDHIPMVMPQVRKRFPQLRLSLHTGHQAQVENWLRDGEIDLAVTSAGARPAAKLRHLPLARIPLVLLVHRTAPWKNVDDLLARKKIPEPLVGQPATTSVMQNFQRDLKRRRVTWPQALEATSVELVLRYVSNGEGFGVVNLAVATALKHREVRALPLGGFEPIMMAAVWSGDPAPHVRAAIEELRRYSDATFPEWKCVDQPPWFAEGAR